MNLTKILTVVFFVVAIGVGYLLYDGVNTTIEEAKEIERVEKQVIAKLEKIRSAQEAHLATYGDYADTWEKLIAYVDTGKIYLITRTEEIIMKAYQEEESVFTYDTVGVKNVKDSLFSRNFDARTLPELPHAPGKYFSLYAKDSVRSGVAVDYIEVVDTYPFDRTRTEDHDIEQRRPLRFGSRTDITTAGNWR
ncbi:MULTISPECIES: hypothetical protein [Roseivirga]|uniref:Uncharacterized protein n=1 Tax=Roseivirga spongicola TaxID=333140 RepID=A0A150XAI5_9BACT|nr:MULTISPECIES: hypothetical protein [Roseivirga]KYG75690.1 hypothetical protein AWW68_07600 [Roseivirga spongicola]MBO6662456.1 hypothetical protein [Roseivirga sp.]MBO6763165.1 hypothetical protein [Roseivirga sp.]MBO6909980.1 hypothetical protein [Roseivirga sp.]WPZ10746.1 hypothetical protein T7867_01370 [Roseivirga spongicola]